jgi:hypothetical protein
VVITGSSTLLRRSRRQLAASLVREQRARAMAEAADRTKDDFLALITHELQRRCEQTSMEHSQPAGF